MIRHWLPVLVTGSLAAVVFLSWALAMARAGSRDMPPMPADQRLRARLRTQADRIPVGDGMAVIEEKIDQAWQGFVHAHEWPGSCRNCVWWVPAPSEAEDAIAVYRPCPRHDPALWPEQEKKAGQ